MSALDPKSLKVIKGSLVAFQSIFANSTNIEVDTVQISIAISKQSFGQTRVLEVIDTGEATWRGQGDRGYNSDNIRFNSDVRLGVLAGLTHAAWLNAAAQLRDPNIVATGTVQVSTGPDQYTNISVEVKQENNTIHIIYLETYPRR